MDVNIKVKTIKFLNRTSKKIFVILVYYFLDILQKNNSLKKKD